MTVEEKLEMYKGKKAFIDSISRVFEENNTNSSVVSVNYEVYHKEVVRDENTYQSYREFVVVNYVGGGKSVKTVSGNSNTANFRVIGTMLDGGYYDEVQDYNSLIECGYELLDLTY